MKTILSIPLSILAGSMMLTTLDVASQDRYVGSTMNFTHYLENRCGIIFKEEGIPTDPFESLANHGANIVRLTVGLPPFASSYSEFEPVDHHAPHQVKIGMQRARDAGLKTLLTFTYQSYALEDEDNGNLYVAPKDWQEIALDLDRVTDSVYDHTFRILEEFCNEGLIPVIVSIGNESSWHRLMPNLTEDQLPAYDPARSVAIHNAGSKAVRDIAALFDTTIKVCFHMRGPGTTKWWLEAHKPYGPDLDMIGISLYPGWNNGDYAGFPSLGEYISHITNTYGLEFLVMETAQLFTSGGNDSHVDILGLDNIPAGYSNPPTAETQKQYLIDLTHEVFDHGGSGVVVWGGEWVASDCYIYADPWGKGSSWENKAFWDFNNNLHDGVNWMMHFTEKVPVTFKVRVHDVDTTRGIYVRGDFINLRGDSLAYNRMNYESDLTYSYTTYLLPGSTGFYYFLSDTVESARESVPAACEDSSSTGRIFAIPDITEGEIFASLWASCDSLQQHHLSVTVEGSGTVSPVSGIYSEGIRVQVQAVAAEGWEFENWSGDTISEDNPVLIHMTRDMQLRANFRKKPDVPVSFKVDMTGIDVSEGVYVTGEFPNQQGEMWQLNRMAHEGNQVYSYSTWISTGSSGAYYFLNDDVWGVRESVPAACAVHWGVDRGFEIPLNSTGEVFAYVWSSCEEIGTVSVPRANPYERNSLVNIFPNPIENQPLVLQFFVEDEISLSVYSITGVSLITTSLNVGDGTRHQIDLETLPEGAYVIRVDFARNNHNEMQLIIK